MDLFFDIPRSVFLEEYLYNKPYVFKGALTGEAVTWKDVNAVYGRADVADRSFKLMDGYEVPKSEYVESYINVGEVEYRIIRSVLYNYMRGGATLVYNRIKNEPFVENISRKISAYAGAQTIVSGYAAFSGKSSYRSHWDTRDVFAVQLLGKKRWVVKRPNFELPLYVQQTKDMPGFSEPEDVYLDVVIEPGDVIYVPRGWWHNPLPVGGETFHLAVGTFAPTGFDYLRWLVGLSPKIFEVRNNLHEFDKDSGLLEGIANGVAELIRSEGVFEEFMRAYIGQHRVDSNISLDILGNGGESGFCLGSRVRVNANLLYFFKEGFLLINGSRVNVDGVGLELVKYIFDEGECKVEDVCREFGGYDEDVVMKLLFQLGLSDVLELVC